MASLCGALGTPSSCDALAELETLCTGERDKPANEQACRALVDAGGVSTLVQLLSSPTCRAALRVLSSLTHSFIPSRQHITAVALPSLVKFVEEDDLDSALVLRNTLRRVEAKQLLLDQPILVRRLVDALHFSKAATTALRNAICTSGGPASARLRAAAMLAGFVNKCAAVLRCSVAASNLPPVQEFLILCCYSIMTNDDLSQAVASSATLPLVARVAAQAWRSGDNEKSFHAGMCLLVASQVLPEHVLFVRRALRVGAWRTGCHVCSPSRQRCEALPGGFLLVSTMRRGSAPRAERCAPPLVAA